MTKYIRATVVFDYLPEDVAGEDTEEKVETLEEHLQFEGDWGYLSRGEFEEADFVKVSVVEVEG